MESSKHAKNPRPDIIESYFCCSSLYLQIVNQTSSQRMLQGAEKVTFSSNEWCGVLLGISRKKSVSAQFSESGVPELILQFPFSGEKNLSADFIQPRKVWVSKKRLRLVQTALISIILDSALDVTASFPGFQSFSIGPTRNIDCVTSCVQNA